MRDQSHHYLDPFGENLRPRSKPLPRIPQSICQVGPRVWGAGNRASRLLHRDQGRGEYPSNKHEDCQTRMRVTLARTYQNYILTKPPTFKSQLQRRSAAFNDSKSWNWRQIWRGTLTMSSLQSLPPNSERSSSQYGTWAVLALSHGKLEGGSGLTSTFVG